MRTYNVNQSFKTVGLGFKTVTIWTLSNMRYMNLFRNIVVHPNLHLCVGLWIINYGRWLRTSCVQSCSHCKETNSVGGHELYSLIYNYTEQLPSMHLEGIVIDSEEWIEALVDKLTARA